MASLVCPRMTAPRTLAIQPSSAVRRIQVGRTFYTTTVPLHKKSRATPSRPSINAKASRTALFPPTAVSIRHESSTSTPNSANTTSEEVLTWDRFFDLRRKRRYINLAASATTALGTIGVFGPVLASQDIDGWAAQISGLDPLLVLGITSFAVAAGGWLCGPTLGTTIFKLWAGRKGWNRPIAEKEKSFYARIKRYRADPASSSIQNPIPDYYGEKIGSVKDYRRWLKDQRAFNLKKNKNLL